MCSHDYCYDYDYCLKEKTIHELKDRIEEIFKDIQKIVINGKKNISKIPSFSKKYKKEVGDLIDYSVDVKNIISIAIDYLGALKDK